MALLVAFGRPSAAEDPKWEVEVHGGGMLLSKPSAGTTALPLPGPVVVPSPVPLGGISSRVVPSWYFGDGALQFNQAIGFRLGPITSLDAVLQSRFAERQPGGSFGICVRRSLGARFAVELAVDDAFDKLVLNTSSMKGIEDSRLSFVTAWNAFFKGISGGTQMVTSNATVSDRRGRQLITAGSLVFDLRHVGRITPYASVGGGYISNRAGAPSSQLMDNYRVTLPETSPPVPVPPVVFDQTDTVIVRSTVENRFAWVLGGGIKYAVHERWGLRFDVRDHISRDRQRTELDAVPSMAPSAVAGSFTIITTPVLFFSTRSSIPSTLGGAGVTGFTTFQASGWMNQANVSAGMYWRF